MKLRNQMFVFVMVLACAVSHAEDEPLVQEGTLTEVSQEIGKLVQLKWNDGRLVIDREHWLGGTAEKSDEERLEERIKSMIDRGIPERIARRMAKGGGGGFAGGRNFLTSSPEGQLFEEIKVAANAMSGGGGGGGDERHWDGHGESVYLSMHTRNSTNGFRFMIRDAQAAQELSVEEDKTKGLRIQFSDAVRILVFAQAADGVVRVAHTSPDRSDAFATSSYEAMLDEHPKFAADFAEILESLGINRPLSNHDPRVLQTIGKMVVQPDEATLQAARKAISLLGSDSFRVRENAEKLVTENAVAWQSVIRDKLATDDLNTEVRIRLQSVITTSDIDSSAAKEFVEERKLLEDADYLRSILDELPESLQGSVRQRLDDLELQK